jgi:hypothetical protein
LLTQVGRRSGGGVAVAKKKLNHRLRATDLDDAMTYIKAACISIAQKVGAGEAPPRKKPDDGDDGWLRPKEVGMFKVAPVSDTVSGHHFQGMLDLIEEQALTH